MHKIMGKVFFPLPMRHNRICIEILVEQQIYYTLKNHSADKFIIH